MKNVTITRGIKLTMTSRDWQLYSDMEGAAKAAHAINRGIEDAVNTSADRKQAEKKGMEVLNQYGALGAYDTEPCNVLRDLLDSVYV